MIVLANLLSRFSLDSSSAEEGAPCTRSAQCQTSTGFYFEAEGKLEEFLNMDNASSLELHCFTLVGTDFDPN